VTLSPLQPAVDAGIADDNLDYEWVEKNVRAYYAFTDDDLDDRVEAVSGRGAIALTLAVGEWIYQRYTLVSNDPAPMEYLESAWAEQMEPGQGAYIEVADDDWRGPARGPLSMIISIANDALFCLDEDEDVAARVSWMTNFARHVLPSQDAFTTWLDEVIERLARHHPLERARAESLAGDEFELGRPVARELFDTTRPFHVGDEAALIGRFLAAVDPRNPFLAANEDDTDDQG
jgi:hypothetical protein